MKYYLRVVTILLVVLLTAGVCISKIGSEEAAQPVIKQDSLSGIIDISKERYVLVSGKTKLMLAMVPPAAMDSLNFHPKDDDTLSVRGIKNREALVVYVAWWKGQQYTFRDNDGKPVWKGTATWQSNPKTCIGCKLCFNNCPADAITMVKVNGAFKAQIDQTKCTGCNTCIAGTLTKFAGCPVKAITK
jgi:ferredoxin